MRTLIAGLLAGLAMFVWAALAHVVLPLGEVGVSRLPHEADMRGALHAAIGEAAGLYVFPSEMNAKPGPSGFLVYNPGNVTGITPPVLGGELVAEVVQSLIAAALVGVALISGYWRRVGFVALIGVAAALSTSGSYWLWYRFPTDYTLGYMFVDLVRYVVAGLVIAALVKPRASPAAIA